MKKKKKHVEIFWYILLLRKIVSDQILTFDIIFFWLRGLYKSWVYNHLFCRSPFYEATPKLMMTLHCTESKSIFNSKRIEYNLKINKSSFSIVLNLPFCIKLKVFLSTMVLVLDGNSGNVAQV